MAKVLGYLRSLLPWAKASRKDERYDMFLHRAVKIPEEQTLIEWLLDLGEDVNASDENGLTALHLAAGLQGKSEVVELLLGRGADIPGLSAVVK